MSPEENVICPICGLKMDCHNQPLMVTTREVKDAVYWDINVYQFQCENSHNLYFNYNQK